MQSTILNSINMKKIILFVVISFNLTLLSAQCVFYGYPRDEIQLKDTDVIVVNIPNNMDARFKTSNELNSLLNLIKNI
mgnify:CR=1 FL=1